MDDQDMYGMLLAAEMVYRDAKNILGIIKKRAAVEQDCYRFKARMLQQSQRPHTSLGANPLALRGSNMGNSSPLSVYSVPLDFRINSPRSGLSSLDSEYKMKIEAIKNGYLEYVTTDTLRHEKIYISLMERIVPELEDALKRLYGERRAAYISINEFKKTQKEIEVNVKKTIKDLNMYKLQKHNLSGVQKKYMLLSNKPRDTEFIANKISALHQRITYHQELALVLRNLYIDMDRTKYAILSPRVCRTLYESIDETINLFLKLVESSAAEEMATMSSLQVQLGDLTNISRDSRISRSTESKEMLPLLLKNCKSFSFFNDNPYYISDMDEGVINALNSPVMYRREDITTGWVRLSFMLLVKSRELLGLSCSDTTKIKKRVIYSVDIRVFVLIDLDSSCTGYPHSLQLVTLNGEKKQVHTISAGSRLAKEKWILVLGDMAGCCFKNALPHNLFSLCSTEKSYSRMFLSERCITGNLCPTGKSAVYLKGSNDSPSIYKSIRITIHDLRPPQKKVSSMPSTRRYCSIFVGGQKRAQTSDMVSDQYICEDTFEFRDICLHTDTICIVLLERRDYDLPVALGHTTISLPNYPSIQEFNSVVQLNVVKQVQGIQVMHTEEKYYLRMSYLYKSIGISTIDDYSQFLNLLKSDNFELVKALDTVISPQSRNTFSHVFLNLLIHMNSTLDCFKSLVSFDIEKTKFANIIFRSNTIFTKTLDQYFKLAGCEYLQETVGKFLDDFSNRKKSPPYEASITGTDINSTVATDEMFEFAQRLWDIILESKTSFPMSLRIILSHLVKTVRSRWDTQGDEGDISGLARYFAVNSFVFLRFLCPAIMAPHLFNVRINKCDAEESFQLKSIAKIIQSLANVGSSSGRSNSTIKNISTFTDRNTKSMMEFMDYISDDVYISYPETNLNTRLFTSRDIRYNIECVVLTFADLEQVLKAVLKPEKSLSLCKILRNISERRKKIAVVSEPGMG